MARKNKREVMLPDLKGITIIQSNRVTNARYEYTLMQERVFTCVMYHLQEYIQEVMRGKEVYQLDIFRQQVDTYMLNIPMDTIGKPSQYRDIRTAIEQIATIVVQMKNPLKHTVKMAGLFSSVEMPDHESKKRSKLLTIEIRKDVAALLIDIDKQQGTNRPSQYTKFMLHTCINSQCKYTSKIYKLLCSWKEKQIYTVKLEAFREFLQLPADLYHNFYDFKRFVLAPVSRELKQLADLYFDIGDPDLVVYDEVKKKKVIGLRFVILEPMGEEMFTAKKKVLFWHLKNTFGCKPHHVAELEKIITIDVNWNLINKTVDRCIYLCEKREVQYPAAFIVKSLQNAVATGESL